MMAIRRSHKLCERARFDQNSLVTPHQPRTQNQVRGTIHQIPTIHIKRYISNRAALFEPGFLITMLKLSVPELTMLSSALHGIHFLVS